MSGECSNVVRLNRTPVRVMPEMAPASPGLYEWTVPAFSGGLVDLVGLLNEAVEEAPREGSPLSDLLAARLPPDRQTLSQRIAQACAEVRGCVALLTDAPAPRPPQVRCAAEARAVIDEALSDLWECDRTALDAAAARLFEVSLPDGTASEISGAAYVRDYAIPKFYFHLAAAHLTQIQ